MKVLLTGATGFLGSRIVKALLEKKYQVVILKRSFSDTWRINDLLSQLSVYDIDLCNLSSIFEKENEINAVIHTATCYGKKGEKISQIFEANTYFPLNLIETAIEFIVGTFINTDTYYNKCSRLYSSLSDYVLSKRQFLEWSKLFVEAKKIKFINAQLEHIFGPNDDESKFTSYVFDSCMRNVSRLNLTKGLQKRDFIYIDDVVSGYMVLLDKLFKQPLGFYEYEIGSGHIVTIREFVEKVHEITKSKTVLNFGEIPYRNNEIMESQANIEPLKKLGWSCKVDLEEGIKAVIKNEE